MTLLVSRRVPFPTRPKGGFLYALVTTETHSIQIGVGHESISGLNVSHVMTMNLKPGFAYEVADQIEREGFTFKAGKLAPFFGVDKTLEIAPSAHIQVPTELGLSLQPLSKLFAEAIRMAHDAVWGHPEDWRVEKVDLTDGRCIWLAYDSVIDKIRIGLGYYDESNTALLGDQSFAVNKRGAGDFVVDTFTKPGLMYFYALPPRYPQSMARHIGHENKQKVSLAFLKLADRVWRGEVKTTERRPLTDAEIAKLNGPPRTPVEVKHTAAQEVLDAN